MKINNKIILPLLVLVLLAVSCNKAGITEESELIQSKESIIETGQLAAVQTRSFVLPRYGRWWYRMKIIGMLDHGKEVKAGDSIIQLDPSDIQKFIIDRESDLETQNASLAKLLVNLSNRSSELASNLENQQTTFDLSKLELESSKFESEKTKQIKNLEFEQAKIQLEKTQRQVELNKKLQAYDLKIQKLRINRLKNEIKNAYSILPRLTIRTPISGIFQIADKDRSRELLRIGDEIWAGTKMGNVPDLKWMKVNTTINEHDFMKIYIGQPVRIRMDALPELEFMGKVDFISKLCYLKDENSKQKIFDLEVKLNESDERLKPGMTVSCEFLDLKEK